VHVGGRPIRVYSLHLGTPINLSPQQRRDQLEAVLADAEGSGEAAVLGGDFNGKSMAERAAARACFTLTFRRSAAPGG
jgi:endonuclease/exonuclease/phosphatase family metal-dependent hydrolase